MLDDEYVKVDLRLPFLFFVLVFGILAGFFYHLQWDARKEQRQFRASLSDQVEDVKEEVQDVKREVDAPLPMGEGPIHIEGLRMPVYRFGAVQCEITADAADYDPRTRVIKMARPHVVEFAEYGKVLTTMEGEHGEVGMTGGNGTTLGLSFIHVYGNTRIRRFTHKEKTDEE